MKRTLLGTMLKRMSFVVAGLAVALGTSGVVQAWSPARPTYTIEHPADHVTFNSITNNPNYGDERTFFDAKDATNTTLGGFVDRVSTKENQELLLRVYVHNNAADNLNGTNFTGPGVAKNTRVRIFLPTATAQSLRANAYISADNATPKEVADTVDFASANGSTFGLEYVPGSAVAYTNAVPKGMKLSDSIVGSGAQIGYQQPNGIVPGCFKYTSIVTIKVKVKSAKYTLQKQVAPSGQNPAAWAETATVKRGDSVTWLLSFKNTGSVQLKNVKVVDEVPAGLTVVPGSVKLTNSNHPNGIVLSSSAVQANGRQINVDIGTYNPGGAGYLTFKTTVDTVEGEAKCKVNMFDNKAFATPEGHSAISDTASVTASAETCQAVQAAVTPTPNLPNTGAGDVLGIFAATSVAGAVAYRWFIGRRLARNSL